MPVKLNLDDNAALILLDSLASKTVRSDEPALRNALWSLEAALERKLSMTFSTDYDAQLQRARRAIVEEIGD